MSRLMAAIRAPRGGGVRRAAAGLILLGATALPARAADEGQLLSKIKTEVFDQQWDSVLGSCDQFISQYSRSQALPRAYFYRAQALEHVKGKETEAVEAYSVYLTKFPNESGALKEDALLSRLTLATALYLKGDKKHTAIILEGMDLRGYPRIYAAIQASKFDHGPARKKAMPILKDCVGNESDAELKNECILAILRIDPMALPPAPPAPPAPAGYGVAKVPKDGKAPPPPPPPAAAGPPRLIRVEIYDKAKKQVTVRVNLPLAFAELLVESLGDEYKNHLQDELNKKIKIPDMQKFWQSLKESGPQTIIEVDHEEHHIKVWIE